MVTQLTRNSDPATMRPSRNTRLCHDLLFSLGNSSSAAQALTGKTRKAASATDGNGTSFKTSS